MAAITSPVEEVRARACETFAQEFGQPATVCACAPGRVNLIGEHVDYNEGFVLPMALPMVTIIAGRPNSTKKCKIISKTVSTENVVEFELKNRKDLKPGEPKWANYVKGCIYHFPEDVPGFDAVIISTVPVGAGLSSSAALEVATFTFLEGVTGKAVDKKEKALSCQKCEHTFANVPCGIMDQFISVMGEPHSALLLDCKDLSTKQIEIPSIDNFVFLIINSNAPHKLSSSEYRNRRDACETAAKELGVKSLREAKLEDLEKLKSKGLPEQTLRYCRHVITEIKRTLDAAAALEIADFEKFGQLMNLSHDSLRDDFQVSSTELNTLVDAARESKSCLGSRLTGAGFGGCTVTLVKKEGIEELIQHMAKKYPGKADFYIAKPSVGARLLNI